MEFEIRFLRILFTISIFISLLVGLIVGIVADQLIISPQFQIRVVPSKSIRSPIINKSPTITNVSVSDITENSASIKWKTDIPATSQVAYCQPKSYSCLSDFDAGLKTDHSIQLKGLSPATYYEVSIFSIDVEQHQAELQLINGLTTLPAQVVIKPVITEIAYTESTQSIICVTDKPAICQVKIWCGPEDSYYLKENQGASINHIIFVNKSGALAAKEFNYQVMAEDGAGNRSDWSSPLTFQSK